MVSTDRRIGERRQARRTVKDERRKSTERRHGDRREASRLSLELWMEEVTGEDVYFRRSGNVSAHGVFFDRAIPHPVGTEVTLKFTLPGDKEMIVARGCVVNVSAEESDLGMGLRLMSFEGDGQKRLGAYLASAR